MTAGYPPNDAPFPGAMPLYASRAVQRARTAADPPPLEPAPARACAMILRTGSLSAPSIEALPGGVVVEPRRTPRPEQLERASLQIQRVEDLVADASASEVDRLMGWACLVALYDRVSVDFELAGEHQLATLAARSRERAARRGGEAVGALGDRRDDLWRAISADGPGRTWPLLLLPGGAEIVLEAVSSPELSRSAKAGDLAALVVAPATRRRAFALLAELSHQDQIEVMHEIFLAYDNLRPWRSKFVLLADGGSDVPVAYAVFHRLAWELWEERGLRPVGEVVQAFAADARARGLAPAWEAALFEYYAEKMLAIHELRAEGGAVVRALRLALEARPHPSLDLLARRLAHLEAAGLDRDTLAEAMRMR